MPNTIEQADYYSDRETKKKKFLLGIQIWEEIELASYRSLEAKLVLMDLLWGNKNAFYTNRNFVVYCRDGKWLRRRWERQWRRE